MDRPFFNASIAELEAKFGNSRSDRSALESLLRELEFRSKPRAVQLRDRVVQALGVLRSLDKPVSPPKPNAPRSTPKPAPAAPAVAEPTASHVPTFQPTFFDDEPLLASSCPTVEVEPRSAPKVEVRAAFIPHQVERAPRDRPYTDRPADILSAWTALEVLSPFTFVKPQDLAEGDERRIARFGEDDPLPWVIGKDKAKPNTQLFYHVVLGAIRMAEATSALLQVFADSDVDRSPARGFAGIATITVTRDGLPVPDNAVAISSFAWGLPLALRRDLVGLGQWPNVEGQLRDFLDKKIRGQDEEGNPLPLDLSTIDRAYSALVDRLGIASDFVDAPGFAIRQYHYWKATEPPDPPLLGSFYLGDLALAQSVMAEGKHRNLARYLGKEKPNGWHDLLEDARKLTEVVRPRNMPAGRWTGENRYPLVLMQQAAVNLAMSGDATTSILPVNGPPGTGKTTLLRDLVAALLVRRAAAMAAFDDPEEAFVYSGQKQRSGAGFTHIYTPRESICGFEMIVASSNNKAVENVSKELPLLKNIADDAPDLRYFKTVSDRLARGRDDQSEADETWGMIAAVLGNASNRYAFREAFWGDPDFGLRPYLCEATGNPQFVEEVDPKTNKVIRKRRPEVVAREHPPTSHDAALKQWRSARKQFQKALSRMTGFLEAVERAQAELGRLDRLRSEARVATELLAVIEGQETRAQAALSACESATKSASLKADELTRHMSDLNRDVPGILSKVFGSAAAKDWEARRNRLTAALASARDSVSNARTIERQARDEVAALRAKRTAATQQAERLRIELGDVEQLVSLYLDRCAPRAVDQGFFRRSHAERHCAAPWLDAEAQRLRDEVFEAAIRVHRAFVGAAAKPMRNNLDALFKTFFGRAAWSPKMRPLMPSLWKTLFLSVPVISTTFASIERMLGFLPPEELGWLLVDEAGQACPQEAVGALIRVKRAVVVGDPLQVQPVTSLPTQLAEAICDDFNVNPDRWNAPEASVQTVADATSSLGGEFELASGKIRVGVPLLVHRRCSEPMFTVSNEIAYNNLMVKATQARQSKIRDVLGQSRWIDVSPGRTEDKWSEAEGLAVRALIKRLEVGEIEALDLYIITPFRIVAQKLRERLAAPGVLNRWTDKPWEWARDHIGTVHTVQGREADSVIFVLGAALPAQGGARGWAGATPNLLNVAVTRAKENIYVVGSHSVWQNAGLFGRLANHLPVHKA